MGKDSRGAAKSERAWLRREAERRALKAKAGIDHPAQRPPGDSEMPAGESN